VYLLLAAALGAVFGVAWVFVTGQRSIPYLAVIGFALAAGILSDLAEKAIKRRRLRRGRPRRAHARPHPAKTRKEA
jgi:hypothetical protein